MLLMTLRGIKRMLDKALDPSGIGGEPASITPRLAHIENARDMLEELIKELEKKPKAITMLPTSDGDDLDPEATVAKDSVLGE